MSMAMPEVSSTVEVAERLRVRERPLELPVMRQHWQHLAFLHWPVDPEAVARLLPPGLDVDTYEGRAYVGLVPFTVTAARPPLLPPAPLVSSFHEVNVRTYVHRAGRDPGAWFFSLDAASRLAVAGARVAYHLPYFYARMELTPVEQGDRTIISYSSRRVARAPEPPRLACSYWPTGPAAPVAPGTLEHFLIERYLLYSWDGRRLHTARVFHEPYPVQPAAVADLAETLTAAAGLPHAPEPPLAHYAREVHVRVYRPRVAT
jgi:uncharacterized protein YqjF (DUF2071 family)